MAVNITTDLSERKRPNNGESLSLLSLDSNERADHFSNDRKFAQQRQNDMLFPNKSLPSLTISDGQIQWSSEDFAGRGSTCPGFRKRATQLSIQTKKTFETQRCSPRSEVGPQRLEPHPKRDGILPSIFLTTPKADGGSPRLKKVVSVSHQTNFENYHTRSLDGMRSKLKHSRTMASFPTGASRSILNDVSSKWAWKDGEERPTFRCTYRPKFGDNQWDGFYSGPALQQVDLKKTVSVDSFGDSRPSSGENILKQSSVTEFG